MMLPVELIELILSYTNLATIQGMMKFMKDDLLDDYRDMLDNYVFGIGGPNIFRKDTGEMVFGLNLIKRIKVKNLIAINENRLILTKTGELLRRGDPLKGTYLTMGSDGYTHIAVDSNGDLFRIYERRIEKLINVGTDIKKIDKTIGRDNILILKTDGTLWIYESNNISNLFKGTLFDDMVFLRNYIGLIKKGQLYLYEFRKQKLGKINIPPVVMMRKNYDIIIVLDNKGDVWEIDLKNIKLIIPKEYNIVTISDPTYTTQNPIYYTTPYEVYGIDINGSLVKYTNGTIIVEKTTFQYPDFALI